MKTPPELEAAVAAAIRPGKGEHYTPTAAGEAVVVLITAAAAVWCKATGVRISGDAIRRLGGRFIDLLERAVAETAEAN